MYCEWRKATLYSVLLNRTLFWILTMPLLLTRYALICFAGLAATLISAILYTVSLKKGGRREDVSLICVPESKKKSRVVWGLWGLFFLVYSLAATAAIFGSHLWFGHPVEITGPYDLANIAVHFYIPILTVFFPITVGNMFYALPLNNIAMKFQLDPEARALTVHYLDTVWNIGEEKVKRDLIYNTAAAMAAVDNLAEITYEFSGSTYYFSREQLEAEFGMPLSELLTDNRVWKEKVREQLQSADFVKRFF